MEMEEIVYVRDANGNLVQTTIKDLRENRLEKLEEENEKLREELQHYKNTEAIQKSNANSMIYGTYTISKI